MPPRNPKTSHVSKDVTDGQIRSDNTAPSPKIDAHDTYIVGLFSWTRPVHAEGFPRWRPGSNFFFLRFSDVGDNPVHPLNIVSLNDLFSSVDESGKGEKPPFGFVVHEPDRR